MYDERKYANFNRMLKDAKTNAIDEVNVAYPWVLGDDYEEIIENLSRIADAGLTLRIIAAAPGPRTKLDNEANGNSSPVEAKPQGSVSAKDGGGATG